MSVHSGSQEENIEITIRCAFQTTADQTMSVPLSWNVKQLKEHILANHPSRPAINAQKLIFCGRCLNDELTLKFIFNETRRVVGAPQVLHLVHPIAANNSELRQRRPNNSDNATPAPPPSYEQASNAWSDYYTRAMNDPAALNAYREYYNNYMNYYQHYSNAMMNISGPNYPYPHAVYVNNGPGVPVTPYFPNAANLNAGNPVIQNPQVNNPNNVQPQQPAAPGRRLEDGLDLFYKFFRGILLLSAVFLYSSLERFLLVAAIIAIMVFTQHRRAQNRRAALAAAQHVNNNNAGEERIHDPAPGEQAPNTDGSTDSNEGTDNEETEENTVPEPAPPSGLQVFFSTCFSFVTSFVASLIPENVPIDVN